MKNPNGYGSVIKLSGNRRKPYIARITTGWNDKGHPIYCILDSFATRQEAMICLAEYNDAQYSVDYRQITMRELFDKLREIEYPRMGKSLQASLNAAYGHCGRLHGVKYRQIKKYMMQRAIDDCPRAAQTKANIKNLFSHLDALARELDVIKSGYADLLTVPTPAPAEKQVFTAEEIAKLWKHEDIDGAQIALMLIYTGFRKNELYSAAVDLDALTFTGGNKSRAGKKRVVPIHPAIEHIVRGSALLGKTARALDARFAAAMDALGMEHTPHDARHTFRTELQRQKVDKVIIDRLMGHKGRDVGEEVYTHITLDELREAVNKLSFDAGKSGG